MAQLSSRLPTFREPAEGAMPASRPSPAARLNGRLSAPIESEAAQLAWSDRGFPPAPDYPFRPSSPVRSDLTRHYMGRPEVAELDGWHQAPRGSIGRGRWGERRPTCSGNLRNLS